MKYPSDTVVCQVNTKHVYHDIISTVKIQSRVERNNRNLSWKIIQKVAKDLKPWEVKIII